MIGPTQAEAWIEALRGWMFRDGRMDLPVAYRILRGNASR